LIDDSAVQSFADLSGDRNPIHLDADVARSYGYHRQVAHGAILVNLLSRVIGMDIPGPGSVMMSQSTEWTAPVFVGDEVELVVTVENLSLGAGIISLSVYAQNQNGYHVMKGEAKVKMVEPLAESTESKIENEIVALVTGASGGIGSDIARRLSQNGVTVAVNFLESKDSANLLAQEIQQGGGTSQAFAADLGNPSATSDLVKEVIRCFGKLDVVVHGASPAMAPQKIEELQYGDFESFHKVHVGGALALMAGASPGMIERNFGRFVFLGDASMFGTPPTALAAYLTSKEALWGLVKSMAADLGPSGITTNMVSPSITVTELTAFVPARVKEVAARTNPMRRLATTEDTAEVVAFLASEAAGFINGSNIPVAGGTT